MTGDLVYAPHPVAISFTVPGESIPQGSTKAFTNRKTGRPIVTSDNPRTKSWRVEVAGAAREALSMMDLAMLTGPVELYVCFWRSRPKGHFGRRGLLPSALKYPTTKPDIDKLARAVLDALTDVVYRDDAQVVALAARMVYIDDPTRPPDTTITVTDLGGQWDG